MSNFSRGEINKMSIQGTPEWHIWRAKGIGSSEAAAVMGVSPYMTREDLLLEKIGKGKPVKINEAMRLGTRWESAARALFFFEHDVECDPAEIIHPEHNFIRASLDGYNPDLGFFLEIKYMGQKNFDKASAQRAIQKHHDVQVQHQFLVTGLNKAYYVPYTLNKEHTKIESIAYIVQEPSFNYINNDLLPALKLFWDEVKQRSDNAQKQEVDGRQV